MKLYKNMENTAVIAIEICYYHTDMNGLVFHVDIMYLKENMNYQKYKERKLIFINRKKYAEIKIVSICVDLYKLYDGDENDEIYKVLSSIKNKKLKINNTLIDIYIKT